jgi:hypothetical protein
VVQYIWEVLHTAPAADTLGDSVKALTSPVEKAAAQPGLIHVSWTYLTTEPFTMEQLL